MMFHLIPFLIDSFYFVVVTLLLLLLLIVAVVFLLLHVVVLPDHLPSTSHDRTRDPTSRYPWLQEREAWEPNADPHESEVTVP